jgi:hypothetical protein
VLLNPPCQVDDLTHFQKSLCHILNQMHKARCDEPGESEYAGKNFLEIASSKWADENRSAFLQESQNLMVLSGLSAGSFDENIFMASLAIVQWPPTPGKMTKSHILNWQMSRQSFWKNFIPDKEVHTIALSIAMDKFREAL